MARLQIGVFIDNMGLPLEQALDQAAEMGVDGFQIYVVKGPMLAENMSGPQRKAFRKAYQARGLTLSATCCDFSIGLDKPEAEAIVFKLMAAVDQAVDLGTEIITTHIGHVPADLDAKVCDPMRQRLEKVAAYADSKGVTFATETGPEAGATLAALLDSVDADGIGANFDPANLVIMGFDHMQAARDLAEYIVHAHAKDGTRKGGEVPLGEGDVNFPQYIALMEDIGYEGFHTIEREVGANPVGDIQKAVDFLKGL